MQPCDLCHEEFDQLHYYEKRNESLCWGCIEACRYYDHMTPEEWRAEWRSIEAYERDRLERDEGR